MTGAILAARKARIPVILDGFIATAATVPLFVLNHSNLDHCLGGHRSTEPGHNRLLAALGMEPLLDLGLPFGGEIRGGVGRRDRQGGDRLYTGMATFDEAGVTNKYQSIT